MNFQQAPHRAPLARLIDAGLKYSTAALDFFTSSD
jgi:hypothetical protein